VAELLTQWQTLREQGLVPESLQGTAPGLGNYFPLGDYLRDGLRAFFRAPVTVLTLLAALVVAAVSNFGSDLSGVQRLFYPGFYPGADVGLASVWRILGQIDSLETLWRSFSPALLHFGAVHLVFNSLWLWHFGRMIESRQSSLLYFVVLLFLAFASNMAQYLWSLSANFGGLSGVVYGLLGYIWMWQTVRPRDTLRLPARDDRLHAGGAGGDGSGGLGLDRFGSARRGLACRHAGRARHRQHAAFSTRLTGACILQTGNWFLCPRHTTPCRHCSTASRPRFTTI
jgi:membrane associated rhomboid family serine protease